MNTNETRSESEAAEANAPVNEQDAPGRAAIIATYKKIVPSLSAIAFTFLTIDWSAVPDMMGGGYRKGH